MSDRSGASTFAAIFTLLASTPPLEHTSAFVMKDRRYLAKMVWAYTLVADFAPEQMGVDDELRALGLLNDAGEYGPCASTS